MFEAAQLEGASFKARKLRKTHVIQRATDGEVDALPRTTDATGGFDLALPLAGRAIGDGNGTLEHIENRRGGEIA